MGVQCYSGVDFHDLIESVDQKFAIQDCPWVQLAQAFDYFWKCRYNQCLELTTTYLPFLTSTWAYKLALCKKILFIQKSCPYTLPACLNCKRWLNCMPCPIGYLTIVFEIPLLGMPSVLFTV